MSTHLYKVSAKKEYGKLAKGMSVEIVIRNASRKPTQREVIDAVNQKYGANTAVNGLSLTNFDIVKL
ncbi:peptidase [Empedobacter falsenii]